MQLSFQDTISFKLLHSDEEGCLVKMLIHKVLNHPPKLVQELQRSSLRELLLILKTNRCEIIWAQFIEWNESDWEKKKSARVNPKMGLIICLKFFLFSFICNTE